MIPEVIEVLAPAKINLFLHLISKRLDGYHNIESLIAFTDFGDLIKVEEATELTLEIEGPFAEDIKGLDEEQNLVMRAAVGLNKLTGKYLGAKITLVKNIPVSSGIGGGSSDAAATIKALQKLWHLSIPDGDILKICLSLGADVPACLYGNPVFVSGMGEELRPIQGLSDFYCVLVNPRIQISTPTIFNSFDGGFSSSISHSGDEDLFGFVRFSNDLQKPADVLVPEIQQAIESLMGEKGCKLARMSGSGATCFGLFDKKDDVEKAFGGIKAKNSNWWVSSGVIKGSIF